MLFAHEWHTRILQIQLRIFHVFIFDPYSFILILKPLQKKFCEAQDELWATDIKETGKYDGNIVIILLR